MPREPWPSAFMRRYFFLVLGGGLLLLGVIAVLASPNPVSIGALGVAVFFLIQGRPAPLA